MIGILQGRLTSPWNGQLQCFPRGAWESEFELAYAAGFDAIEALVEAEHNSDNPVWSDDGNVRMREVSRRTQIAVRVLCADCFMTKTFLHESELALRLLAQLAARDFRLIVLPFFGRAALETPADLDRVAEVFSCSSVPPSRLALETTLPGELLAPFIDRTGTTVCYDLGNTTALGHDLPRDIRILGRRIAHVHVKDKRCADGENVLLGTGDADFSGIAAALRDIGYEGDYTCETFRGSDPFETAKHHRLFVERMLATKS